MRLGRDQLVKRTAVFSEVRVDARERRCDTYSTYGMSDEPLEPNRWKCWKTARYNTLSGGCLVRHRPREFIFGELLLLESLHSLFRECSFVVVILVNKINDSNTKIFFFLFKKWNQSLLFFRQWARSQEQNT